MSMTDQSGINPKIEVKLKTGKFSKFLKVISKDCSTKLEFSLTRTLKVGFSKK